MAFYPLVYARISVALSPYNLILDWTVTILELALPFALTALPTMLTVIHRHSSSFEMTRCLHGAQKSSWLKRPILQRPATSSSFWSAIRPAKTSTVVYTSILMPPVCTAQTFSVLDTALPRNAMLCLLISFRTKPNPYSMISKIFLAVAYISRPFAFSILRNVGRNLQN